MKDNELIEILKEFDKKRVEQLNENARKMFYAIMDIANQRDRLLEGKQQLIDYIKEQINQCKLIGNDEDYIKLDAYNEILSKIEKSDNYE